MLMFIYILFAENEIEFKHGYKTTVGQREETTSKLL